MTKENKSKLYKEIINYNALVSATSKVREENIDDKGDVAGWLSCFWLNFSINL